MMIRRPDKTDYPPFYETYIRLIQSEDLVQILENQEMAFYAFVKDIAPDKEDFKYAEGKWSIKEVVGHIIEVERIMAYRALAISRGDANALPGMDENSYIENSNYKDREVKDLAEEFRYVRKSNIILIRSFSPEMLQRKGIANKNEISVTALVYIIAGHLNHHVQILRDRYLND